MQYDVIVIGAGAAGLMASKELVQAGLKVCMLEATGQIGGRIETIIPDGFSIVVEAGAEFIHGDAPLTLDLLDKAHIEYQPVTGKVVTVRNGVWLEEEEDDRSFEMLFERITQLENDTTIANFLDQHFKESEFEVTRKMITQFAENFGLADIHKASIFALKKDWEQIEEPQYRIGRGYQLLTGYLMDLFASSGGYLQLYSAVKKIECNKGYVTIYTSDKKQYDASQVIITVSAGVLQSGSIEFVPTLKQHAEAIRQVGFGSVIKIILQFKEPFWNEKSEDIGFLISDEVIPTWWTQYPSKNPILTGWRGGPGVIGVEEKAIYQQTLDSLASIFDCDTVYLRKQLNHHKIFCWDDYEFIRGGYSYNTIHSDQARKVLMEPANGTIYFAGEAIYSGKFQGTVEAALQSGKRTAEHIMTVEGKRNNKT